MQQATNRSSAAHSFKTKGIDMRNETYPLGDPAGLGIFLVMARALAPAPFQPDFDAHWRNAERGGTRGEDTARDVARDTPKMADAPVAGLRPRKLGWLERLDRWFWAQQQRDIEAYLARSADIHDLEQRMRNLERGGWQRYN
jgi:hypothetical protein